MYDSMVDIQCAADEIRRGEKKKIEDRKKPQKIEWSALFHRATIIRAITPFKVIQGHRFWYKSTSY